MKYKPSKVGGHSVKVQYNNQDIPESPLKVEVVDPGAVKVFGPGLMGAIIVNEETSFTVNVINQGWKGGAWTWDHWTR